MRDIYQPFALKGMMVQLGNIDVSVRAWGTFVLVVVTPASFVPQSYLLCVPHPIFLSSNLSFPLPDQCRQFHLSRIIFPVLFHLHQPVSQFKSKSSSSQCSPSRFHVCFPYCHALGSLLSPWLLCLQLSTLPSTAACSWTKVIHGGQSICLQLIWHNKPTQQLGFDTAEKIPCSEQMRSVPNKKTSCRFLRV